MKTLIVALCAIVLAATAHAQSSRYSAIDGGGDRLQDLLGDLRGLIDDADRARAADPVFLRDLRDLVARYEDRWTDALVSETFSDGDFHSNPEWIVGSGEFYVSRRGLESEAVAASSRNARNGDRAEPSTEELVAGVISSLLTRREAEDNAQEARQEPQPSAHAQIYLPQDISNAFALTAELYQRREGESLELMVYQGDDRRAGYSVLFEPGKNALLVRRSSRGSSVIRESEAPVAFADGGTHVVEWTRTADGTMELSFDGQPVFEVVDRGFRDPFDGFSLINRGGEYGLASLHIDGRRP